MLAHELAQAFPMSSITIKEFESVSFMVDQVDFYSSINILISPHGAQLTGLPFMPNCGALVVELMPKGYLLPNWFGGLAIGSGIGYGFVYMLGRDDAANETKVMSPTQAHRTSLEKQIYVHCQKRLWMLCRGWMLCGCRLTIGVNVATTA